MRRTKRILEFIVRICVIYLCFTILDLVMGKEIEYVGNFVTSLIFLFVMWVCKKLYAIYSLQK